MDPRNLDLTLTLSVICGDMAGTRDLLDRGADINSCVEYPVPPGEDDRKWFLDPVMRLAREGATPLAVAAARGDAELVRLLLRRGANVNARTSCGRTPVRLSANRGHDETTALLLQAGAEINHGRTDDEALLAWAAAGYPSLVGALLDQGAAVDARDDRGRTPLIWTIAAGREIAEEHRQSHRQAARLLLERGADVNARNKYGLTALMFVGKDATAARLLTAYGADPELTDHRGRSARRWAALTGSPEVRELLT
jgi:uncharacterized protein